MYTNTVMFLNVSCTAVVISLWVKAKADTKGVSVCLCSVLPLSCHSSESPGPLLSFYFPVTSVYVHDYIYPPFSNHIREYQLYSRLQ